MRARAGSAIGRPTGGAARACNVSTCELKMAAGMPIPISLPLFPLFPLFPSPCALAYSVAC
jgi:hypothetical protein